MSQKFEQASYWIGRHEQYQGDPRSVGTFANSIEDNFKGEADLKSLIETVAQQINRPGDTVLDLGCGYGRITPEFTGLGYIYTGVDVSQTAIERAKQENPGANFIQADMLSWQPESQFDIVCCLFVLVHFVEDDAWLRFLKTGLNAVKPGGYYVFADHFPVERQSATHYVSRPFAEYAPHLKAAGFAIDPLTSSVRAASVGNTQARMLQIAKKL